MGKSLLVSFDVFAIGFAISFAIAVLIKVLMSGIRFVFSRTAKNSNNI